MLSSCPIGQLLPRCSLHQFTLGYHFPSSHIILSSLNLLFANTIDIIIISIHRLSYFSDLVTSTHEMADFEYVSKTEGTEVKSGPKPPLDLSHHFSKVTIARKESSIKKFYQYFQIPGIANLAGGESRFCTLMLKVGVDLASPPSPLRYRHQDTYDTDNSL